MKYLTCNIGDEIVIGGKTRLQVGLYRHNHHHHISEITARFSIEAPPSIPIWRLEIMLEKLKRGKYVR